jgi:hypothetical protein
VTADMPAVRAHLWDTLHAAARTVRTNAQVGPAAYPFDPTVQHDVATLLDHIAADMERGDAREQDIGYQPTVVDRRYRQPHDTWTTALTLARHIQAGVDQ